VHPTLKRAAAGAFVAASVVGALALRDAFLTAGPDPEAEIEDLGHVLDLYKANAVAADSAYSGHWLQLQGYVNEVARHANGNLFVMVQPVEPGRLVIVIPAFQAFFAAEQREQLAPLRQGDGIEVLCRVLGLAMHVQGDQCEVVRSLPASAR
jgi:hypothetical protein